MDLDLQESLAKSIMKGTGLKLKVAYLSPDSDIGLVPVQGSHVVEADYSGNQLWQYNYAITIKTKSEREAKEKLFAISNYLNGLDELLSGNGSFRFNNLEVSSAPSELLEDTAGTVMYELDIAVFVYTKR